MSARDRTAVGVLSFFVLAAFTVELYWVLNSDHLPERQDWLARVCFLRPGR
jgi:hypothetical protein